MEERGYRSCWVATSRKVKRPFAETAGEGILQIFLNSGHLEDIVVEHNFPFRSVATIFFVESKGGRRKSGVNF
jgi:hypothetical protein